MSLTPAMIDAMVASGCTSEQIAAVVKADMADREGHLAEKRAKDAERQRRHRASRDVTVTERDNADAPSLSRPPNEINSNPPTHTHPDNTIPRARKADPFPCPEGVDPVDWDALKANRKAKRAALTEGAHRQITRKLDTWANDGWPPGPIVAFAAERGWTSVFETDQMKAPQNGRSQLRPANDLSGLRGSRPDPALDMLYQAQRELQAEAEREDPGSDWPARLALPPH